MMKKAVSIKRGGLILALLISFNAFAARTDCPEFYTDGVAPDLVNLKLKNYTKELCYTGHTTLYSGLARAPLWSAQLLTPSTVQNASNIPRSNDFREDENLVDDWRNKLSDFRGSGYDRGHIAPAGDMPSQQADSESFILSNIIAQDEDLNRNLWAAIEMAVRRLSQHKPVYVITGPLWVGPEVNWLRSRVMVPTHIYKLVYDPRTDAAGVYLVENKPRARHREITVSELEALAGISFLPTKSPKILKLPRPRY